MGKRDYQIDNIKGILIFLVVFGHMFLAASSENNWMTTLIYSFHMPMFIFLNGLFSKHVTLKKIVYFGFLYMLVQTFYILIVKFTEYPWIPEFNIIVTPIFHVWYLLSLTIWYLFTIVIQKFSLNSGLVLIAVCLCALSIRLFNFGVDGNYFAYIRTIVFAPFFLFGHFLSYTQLSVFREKIKEFKLFLYFVTLIFISLNIFYFNDNAKEWMRLFFGYVNYANFSDSYFIFICKELLQYFLGAIAIVILLGLVPNNKGLMNYIGQHTLAIFIYHPVVYFIIYNYIERTDPTSFRPFLIAFILTICTIIWSLVVESILKILNQKLFRRIIKS